MMKASIALAAALPLFATPAAGAASQSVFQKVPDDPAAIVVRDGGDGKTDATAILQQAIDAAAAKENGGIVFVPSGRYLVSRTIFVRSGVRIFGAGKTRPVFVLPDRTSGYQNGVANIFLFTGEDQYRVGKIPVPPPTSVPFNDKVYDATSSTFYSSMANVDFEIGEGNPAAAAVRFRVAQHGFLSHIDFHIGSGLTAIYQAGNVIEDVRFYGGRYAILTEKTSPAWQFTAIDCLFDGQRDAAIREHEVDLTLVNAHIRNTPVGIEIDEGYSDSLWGKNVRFDRVSRAAVLISSEKNVFTQIGFDNAVASATPVFARFRESGRTVAGPAPTYRMRSFSYGLTLPGLGSTGTYETRADATPLRNLPKEPARAIRPLPPMSEWTDVRSFGTKGDGKTDDRAAIQRAIDSRRVIYFPQGLYSVSDTVRLRPDTVLIGLHPRFTQIVIQDNAPAFAGVGEGKGIVESAKGGDAIVSGIGLFAGTINPRAAALIWRAGENSLVEDVKIMGGGGTYVGEGKRLDMFDPAYRLDGKYPSIWVTDGGGGTFADIWSPDTFAQAGFYVSNTSTPGHVYELSAEHHVRAEIVLDNVRNWEFLAPQTEEEVRESQDTVSTEMRNSHNILFANYHGYRVTRTVKPAPAAIRLYNSGDIRLRNVHVNAESGYATCDASGWCGTYLRASKFPFENAVQDMTHKLEVREREFAVLDVPAAPQAPQPPARPASLANARVEKLESGFYSISGATVDKKGKLYFVEHRFNRIYGWAPKEGISIVHDHPLDAVNLAVDASGNLLVLSSDGPQATVYSFDPDKPSDIKLIQPTPVRSNGKARTLLPANIWNNGEFRDQLDPKTYRFTTLAEMFARDMAKPKQLEYVSPDGSITLPAFQVIQQGPTNFLGWRFSDTLDTYGFVSAKPGERVTLINGSEGKTYSGLVGDGGAVTDLKVIANRGGESVAVGPDGNVYVANGQIFVYDPSGRELGQIEVPERPIQLIFGGEDGRTLYVLTHHSLYAVRG